MKKTFLLSLADFVRDLGVLSFQGRIAIGLYPVAVENGASNNNAASLTLQQTVLMVVDFLSLWNVTLVVT